MAIRRSGLSASQADSLASICTIGRAGLQLVHDHLSSAGLMISRTQITGLIVDAIGPEAGNELAAFLFGIAAGFREDKNAPEAALSAVSALVEHQDQDSRFSNWEDCRQMLSRLLASQSIRLATKALEVSYDFERIYQTGRFLTTVRPVFNEDRTKILGATVVQTLRLEFVSSSGEQSSLSIALDRADIEQLRESCDEALRKAQLAYKGASEDWKLLTIIPGESNP
jgi:hypothetical protein